MNNYSAVSAKTKAMFGKCMTKENFEVLLSKGSVGDVCSYLKNETSYSDIFKNISDSDIHRGVLEQMLWQKLDDEYERIYNFVSDEQKKILDFRFYRREVDYLKHSIRNLFNKESRFAHIPNPEDFSEYFKKKTKIDTRKCRHARCMNDFVSACEGTPYYGYLKRVTSINSDYFSIAMGLDSLYYLHYYKACKRLKVKEKNAMERFLGSETDMLNIIWIYRSKTFFDFDEEIIFTNLLPVRYRLSEDIIKRIVCAKNDEEIIAVVDETRYKPLFKNISKGFYVDENYRRMMYKIAKSTFVNSSDTIAGIAAYFKIKEFEILNIIRVIEGIRYQISPEVIKKHIRM